MLRYASGDISVEKESPVHFNARRWFEKTSREAYVVHYIIENDRSTHAAAIAIFLSRERGLFQASSIFMNTPMCLNNATFR